MAIGLGVHRGGLAISPVARDVAGDALWAMMIAWWLGVLAPGARLRWRAFLALGICVTVELSQLIRTPALDALRQTRVGRLVLGQGFDPRDLIAYTLGVVASVLLEKSARALLRRRASRE